MSVFFSVLIFVYCVFFHFTSAAFADSTSSEGNQTLTFSPYLLFDNTAFYGDVFIKFLEKQDMHIAELTNKIKMESEFNKTSILRVYNERGIVLLFSGQTDAALDDFNFVIENSRADRSYDMQTLGTAWWGRMLCHAFLNQQENTHDDSLMISSLLDDCACCQSQTTRCNFKSTQFHSQLKLYPIAKFAHPQEKVTKWECHDRTNIIANKMRSLAELIPFYLVKQTVLWTIDRQASKAHQCCENGKHWTECLGPIADVWKKLENTWDELVDLFNKGINLELFLTSPSNL